MLRSEYLFEDVEVHHGGVLQSLTLDLCGENEEPEDRSDTFAVRELSFWLNHLSKGHMPWIVQATALDLILHRHASRLNGYSISTNS